MKAIQLAILILAASITANVYAAPKPPPEPSGPQDVNVVNTPSVTVTNPQTSVTVDNGVSNPVPVSGAVTVGNTTPIPVSVQNANGGCSASQFVGFTTGTFSGEGGVVTLSNACQQQYPGSHMCNSEEFLNTKIYPVTTGQGWIKPTFVPVSEATPGYTAVQDISGVVLSASRPEIVPPGGGDGSGFDMPPISMSCGGWSGFSTYSNTAGLVVDESGRFSLVPCRNAQVACCAPAP